ncbi:MAG: MEDS domain-containing protein [Candidatus Omnitrophota bacterium]
MSDLKDLNKSIRKSGIDAIGNVSWGRHLCVFYKAKEEILGILVKYFKAGLENNEFCIWVASDEFSAEEARAYFKKEVKDLDTYIDKGQMVFGDYKDYYLKEGQFTAFKTLEMWSSKEKEILAKGFEGMRVAGDGSWAVKGNWVNLSYYETEVDRIIENYKIIAICSYSLDRLKLKEIVDIGSSHHSILTKQSGDWRNIHGSDISKIKSVL